ncbi:MAG: endonuclease [Rhodocyclales bacterium CG17_big_fil_post_rev_8_21_14_2_50_68_7]|nr:MAG: hypothetical protein AUK49_07290 [Betaproteobacteria bacterium CG2_30_68_42]PIV72363.1 MAG: endonuclease [Rhodocyclales bacterium CG17_big_fil_post_rev_8_21_14_2_50_68_7]PIX75017.1 MAG: endonuclease [Rhodocyclales bacterium CG_4_10_14_3_um_filter_68_10]PJA58639.1 MAG: endonuclease [Rhodocyclales bacterium CG_4_9_14_3_um_filter_68_10]
MKLVTWNIQWCRGCDGHVDPQRIVEHAKRAADFDVLCVQEVAANFPSLPGSHGENQFEEIARWLPDYTPIPCPAVDALAPDGSRRAFGNMILSRYPVLQVLRHQLPWPGDPSPTRSMPRVLIEATLDAPGGPVRVMTTHLEYYSALQRASQVEAIRAHHAEACQCDRTGGARDRSDGTYRWFPRPRAAILTGDFNIRPDDPLHARLQAPFVGARATPRLADVWVKRHPEEPHPNTVGVHDRSQWPAPYCCDFVFATAGLARKAQEVRVNSDTQASDHQPLFVNFRT